MLRTGEWEKQVITFDLSDPATNENPFPLFASLQSDDPAHWSPSMRAWILTRYDDVKLLATGMKQVSAERITPILGSRLETKAPNLLRYLNVWMSFRDPPEHTRLRRLVSKSFSTKAIELLRPSVEEAVADLIRQLKLHFDANGNVDFVAHFAYPLPATVILKLLGAPDNDLIRIKKWSDDVGLFIGTALGSEDKYARANKSVGEIADYFRDFIKQRRKEPTKDLISHLANAEPGQDALSDDELIGTLIMLLYAGHETTTSLIAKGMYHTITHTREWERIRSNPSMVDTAIEEWLRYDGPVASIARFIVDDFNLHGKQLKKGERIFAFLNAANRDPEHFDRPNELDLARDFNPHIAFGAGAHFCLGAGLARMEAQIALSRLIENMPTLTFAGGNLRWKDSVIMRGIKELPLRLG